MNHYFSHDPFQKRSYRQFPPKKISIDRKLERDIIFLITSFNYFLLVLFFYFHFIYFSLSSPNKIYQFAWGADWKRNKNKAWARQRNKKKKHSDSWLQWLLLAPYFLFLSPFPCRFHRRFYFHFQSLSFLFLRKMSTVVFVLFFFKSQSNWHVKHVTFFFLLRLRLCLLYGLYVWCTSYTTGEMCEWILFSRYFFHLESTLWTLFEQTKCEVIENKNETIAE